MHVKWFHCFMLHGLILPLEINFQNPFAKPQIETTPCYLHQRFRKWHESESRSGWQENLLSQSHVHFLLSSCRNWIKRTLHYPLGKGLALSCSPAQGPCRFCFSAGTTEPGKNPGSDTLKEAYLLSLWSHHKQNRLWMPAYQNVVGEKHMGRNINSLMSKFTALTFLE